MLTAAQNERLTRVGPGTPMGELMRRYWQPIAASSMLDEDPVQRLRILGEELVLYKDLSGELGLVGATCAHRLIDLKFGMPDLHGLRCPYHGWCYDKTGQCIETPLEASQSRVKDRVKIPGYPVQELGGLVFAYMGPLPAPILPPWDFLVFPNSIRQIAFITLPANWLQVCENLMDPFHGPYLHGHFFKYQLEKMGIYEERASDTETHRLHNFMRRADGHAGIVIERDQYGLRKGVRFSVETGADRDYTSWYPPVAFPNLNPARGTAGAPVSALYSTPIDDEHTLHLFYYLYHVPGVEAPKQDSIPYFHVPLEDEKGNPILDYIGGQDFAIYPSQGAIVDRSAEKVSGSDLGVVEWRRLCEDQLQIMESGKDPINVFRDPEEVGDVIEFDPPLGSNYRVEGVQRSAASAYYRGFWRDETDRYGPALDLAIELSRKATEQYDSVPAEAAD